MKPSLRNIVMLLLLVIVCAACGAGGGSEVISNSELRTANIDTSDVLFEPDRLLRIDIEMDPAEYDILRQEGRHFPEVFAGCAAEFEYSHFKATVSVDGTRLNEVDIRKKGFLGSLSASRPSFKLTFDRYLAGQSLESLESMTLNNNRQDRSNTHQCITYQLFRDAGLPAPRCNFARVSLNGADLGIYSNVESIKKHFLRRNFNDDRGNLYEGQVADFGEFRKASFQLKTNEEANDRSDLDAVVAALQASDENLPGLLQQVVDVDEFLSFWAMEGITGHWDSATGNANNYFVYREQTDGLFHYIPWGADASFELVHSLAPGTGPLYRYITIPARLYEIPEYRDRYHARLLQLLDQVWDEQALAAEVDRIRDLTGTSEELMAPVRNFIAVQDARLRAAVAGEIVQLERTIEDAPTVCTRDNISTISGSFSNGLGFFEYLDRDGNTVTVPAIAAAPSAEGVNPGLGDGINMTLVGNVNGQTRLAFINIERGEFGQTEIPFHGVATNLFLIGPRAGQGFGIIGFGGAGTIVFDEPAVLGEPPSFHFSAQLGLSDGSGLGLFGGGN